MAKRITAKAVNDFIAENRIPYQLQGYYENYTLIDEKGNSVYACINESPKTIFNWLINNVELNPKPLPDRMQTTIVSTNGKWSKKTFAGSVYLTMCKKIGPGEKFSQIAVEVEHSTGVGSFRERKEREKALINITFEDGKIWSGSMQDLQDQLKEKGL